MKGFVARGDHERGPPTILALVKFDYVPDAGSLGRWGIRQAEVNYQPCQLMEIAEDVSILVDEPRTTQVVEQFEL